MCDLRNTAGAVTDTADVHLTGSGRLVIASGVAQTVERFYIGGVLQPIGTYTAANLSGSISGGGSLVVTAGVPPVPSGLGATPGDAQVALSWNTVSGATGYTVWRSMVSGSGYTVVGSPTEPAFSETGLVNGTTYYYLVSAINAEGESPASAEVSATLQFLTGDGSWTRLTDGVWDSSGNWQKMSSPTAPTKPQPSTRPPVPPSRLIASVPSATWCLAAPITFFLAEPWR